MDKVAYYAQWYRGAYEESSTHSHQCKGCEGYFPPDLLFIAQDQPDFDWQGNLEMYCDPCLRHGPDNWDYHINAWKSDFGKMIVHPSELGHDRQKRLTQK